MLKLEEEEEEDEEEEALGVASLGLLGVDEEELVEAAAKPPVHKQIWSVDFCMCMAGAIYVQCVP